MLPAEDSLPAAGQGALGIEALASRADVANWVAPLNDPATAAPPLTAPPIAMMVTSLVDSASIDTPCRVAPVMSMNDGVPAFTSARTVARPSM